MLLNFVQDGQSSQTVTNVKGRWKDRMLAKKLMKHRMKKFDKKNSEKEKELSEKNEKNVEEDFNGNFEHNNEKSDKVEHENKKSVKFEHQNEKFKVERKSTEVDDHQTAKAEQISKQKSKVEHQKSTNVEQKSKVERKFKVEYQNQKSSEVRNQPRKSNSKIVEKKSNNSDQPSIKSSTPSSKFSSLPYVQKKASDSVFARKDSFKSLGLNESITNHLKDKMGLTCPTKIQTLTIPALLEHPNQDICIESRTGSGKTLSFLLPLINRVVEMGSVPRHDGTCVLVVSPTRELAQQIYEVMLRCMNFCMLVPGLVVGGDKRKSEKARLRKGVHFLVGTPGRLLDHLEMTSSFELKNIQAIVLDEADRLFDMGFTEKVMKIIELVKKRSLKTDIQVVLCSATLKGKVENFISESLNNPLKIKHEEDYYMPDGLTLRSMVCPARLRLMALVSLLKGTSKKVLLFVSCCAQVDFLHALFVAYDGQDKVPEDGVTNVEKSSLLGGLECYKLHGSIAQSDRSRIYKDFCASDSALLVCTDVAARGLDLPKVDLIVQYDPPCDMNDFIHRVGRTARLNKSGEAVLFLLPSELEYLELLKEKNVKMDSEIQVQDLWTRSEQTETQEFNKVEHWIQLKMSLLARRAFDATVRAYGSRPSSEKHIFHLKKLHLGHMVKAFGIKETPTDIIHKLKRKATDEDFKDMKAHANKKPRRMKGFNHADEFSSGI